MFKSVSFSIQFSNYLVFFLLIMNYNINIRVGIRIIYRYYNDYKLSFVGWIMFNRLYIITIVLKYELSIDNLITIL